MVVRIEIGGFGCECIGIVTRRPLVLQLHKTEGGQEHGEFLHAPKKRFNDFGIITIFPALEWFLFWKLI